ncbi:MAG: carboxypeptidase M32, partial [Tepidisphaeraceae bacterium]
RRYPADAQNAFAREAAKQIGFDFDAGRLDVSVHPFNTGIGPGDCRMTTRYDEHYFGDAFFGVLHESGHGLYEQGLPREHWGSPLGQAISLGIHESQSRMWENLVGRSRPFWKFFFPKLQAAFPQAAAGVSPEQWLRAVNHVEPSLIRTESDEVTYNLHIMLRFEIELNLLTGSLSTKDVPAVWNRTTRDYLGITPPNDAQGCLQDIHWSHGAIGYFPTYTLGNLYAAQFYAQAKADIGGLEEAFAAGDFKPLLGWLREKIHRHGKRYSAGELVRRVTGRALVAKPLLDHLARKTKEAYGV